MPSRILRHVSVAQVFAVLLFVFCAARVLPVSAASEVTTITPVVEQSIFGESKVTLPDIAILVLVALFVPQIAARTTISISPAASVLDVSGARHAILRL